MKIYLLIGVLTLFSIASVFSQITSVKAIQMVGAMAADRTVSGVSDLKLTGGAIYLDGEVFVHNTDALNLNVLLGWTRNTTAGSYNVLIGTDAGKLISSNSNVCIGYRAGYSTTIGASNVFIGDKAGYSNSSGSKNTLVGYQAGYNNNANNNVFYGYQAGYSNTTGSNNSYMGYNAGFGNTTGSDNVAIGVDAGKKISNRSVFLGYGADATVDGLTNVVAIGYNAKVSQSNSVVWGGTGVDAVKVGIYTENPKADLHLYGTDALIVPVGTSLQRPITPQVGMIRFNTDSGGFFEGYVWDTFSMSYTWKKLHP